MERVSRTILIAVGILITGTVLDAADLGQFKIRPITKKELRTFVKVFSEMRGPLRVEILKDSNTNFEDVDPLGYVNRVKNEKDVQTSLKKNKLDWSQFEELMGNVILAYFSTQPNKTKAALIRQLSGYGLAMADDQIPPEYREQVAEILKTEGGATLASFVLDMVVQIPEGNVKLAEGNKRTLDQMFYTKFWKDKI